jgi:glycosyltransferase involved in cell wall biosynthesis
VRVVLFTDSIMHKDSFGRPYPLRDQFIHFICPLAKKVEHLTIVSKCRTVPTQSQNVKYLPLDNSLSLIELPFYSSTEDFYKRLPLILPKILRTVKLAITNNDIVLLRIHNCLSPYVKRIAVKKNRPIVLYWAGPPIFENVKRNYPGGSFKHRIARLVAYIEHLLNFRIVRDSSLNFFIDPDEHKLMGSPKNTQWVVPNLIKSKNIVTSPKVGSNGPLKIIFAGRLFKHKGIYVLLKAMQLLKQRNIAFILHIAGDGPEMVKIRKFIEGSEITDNVSFEGNLSHDELLQLMRSSDVFTLPSYAEGLPKVLWEAWASGCAVVITDVGATPIYVKNRYNGILIKPGDHVELADSIEFLANNERIRFELAATGIESIKNHTWDSEIDNISIALHNVAGNWSNRIGI